MSFLPLTNLIHCRLGFSYVVCKQKSDHNSKAHHLLSWLKCRRISKWGLQNLPCVLGAEPSLEDEFFSSLGHRIEEESTSSLNPSQVSCFRPTPFKTRLEDAGWSFAGTKSSLKGEWKWRCCVNQERNHCISRSNQVGPWFICLLKNAVWVGQDNI